LNPRGLLARYPGARSRLAVSLALTVAAGAALLAWMLLLASVIDRVFLGGDDLGDLSTSLWWMVGILVARGACLWSAEVVAQRSSSFLRRGLRTDLARAITIGSPRRTNGDVSGRDGVGEVTGTLTTGVDALGTWVTSYAPAATSTVTMPAMVLVVVLVLDAPTTLILMFTGPMLILLLALIGRQTADLTRRRFDELGWLRGFYLDMIRGLGTLKAFGRGADGARAIEDTSKRFGDTTMEVLRTAFQTSLVMEWAATAATALVAIEVSFRLIGGSLSYGTALAVLILTPEFFVPFRRLAMEYHAGQSGDAAAEGISGLLESAPTSGSVAGRHDPARAEPARREPPRTGPPRLEFRAVSFSYPGADRPALAGLDLAIDRGETLALVGPSGAGKSTLAALLLRFIAAERGTIAVDGVDLSSLDPRNWRRSVAWVPQDPTLFSGTVADNIALGDPGASRARIEAAADSAGATEFIDALPGTYGAILGEGGTTLSGGQRQRLAIARAFLRDAPLVILDEFTAHLDPDTEEALLGAAGRLLEGRTALLIAHRLTTARSADRIAVLERGRVVESGTDKDLVARSGSWAELSRDPDGLVL
jgi:ATP-binding cassette subfamily C protein CydD